MSQRIIDTTEDDVAPTLTSSKVESRGGSEGPKAFVKRSGAREPDGEETWDEGNVSRTLNGMGQAGTNGALAVTAFSSTESHSSGTNEDISPTLRVGSGLGIPSPPAVAFSPTLTGNDPSRSPQSGEVTSQVDAVHRAAGAVRRLTPTECERLQSFPDGWTAIPKK